MHSFYRSRMAAVAVLAASAVAAAAQSAPAAAGRGERIADRLRARGWSDDVTVAAIAAMPIIELRGAIPVAIHHFRQPWWRAMLISLVGNMAPIPLLLLLLDPVSRVARRTHWGDRFFEWLFARTRRKAADIQKYERLGLALFVAIPLPATGAWTGAMAAVLLGMGFRESFFSILLGVLVAGVIVTILSLLGWLGAAVAAAALLGAMVAAMWRRSRREPAGG